METQQQLTSSDFHLDDGRRELTIAGVRYSYDMFAAFGLKGMSPGSLFRIKRRESGGTLVVECVEEDSLQ